MRPAGGDSISRTRDDFLSVGLVEQLAIGNGGPEIGTMLGALAVGARISVERGAADDGRPVPTVAIHKLAAGGGLRRRRRAERNELAGDGMHAVGAGTSFHGWPAFRFAFLLRTDKRSR